MDGEEEEEFIGISPTFAFSPKIKFLSFCRSQSAITMGRLSGFGLSAVHSFSLFYQHEEKFPTQGSLSERKTKRKKSRYLLTSIRKLHSTLQSTHVCFFILHEFPEK